MMELLKLGAQFEQFLYLRPKCYEKTAHNLYRSVGVFDVDKFGIDPLEITYVNPKNITRVTGREWKPWSGRIQKVGKVLTGDWDKTVPTDLPNGVEYPKRFEQHEIHEAFVSHFDEEVSWGETKRYREKIAKAESESEIGNIRRSLKTYDHLYNNIKEKGYKSQAQLCDRSDAFIDTRLGEILVDIGRDGEILFVDGRHRLSIAKILGLDRIPVFVLVRHKQWCMNNS
ncbi:hypothetical protein GCM10009647_087660 [Streptomyces sanglieri]